MVNIEKPHDQTTKVDQIGKKDTVEKAVRLPKSIEEVGEDASSFKIGADVEAPLNRRRTSSTDSRAHWRGATMPCEWARSSTERSLRLTTISSSDNSM